MVLHNQDYEQHPQTDRELLMVHCFYCACAVFVPWRWACLSSR
jgi:hypothetical protein|eukprot:COSAG02_NODE_14351_length_1281_cov_2.301184_2_plen_43_part_00